MKTLLLFILSACSLHLSAQVTNCAKFKTGYFENIDPSGHNTYIKRTKNFQYEWEKMLGAKITLKIRWIDDCTYALKPVSGNAVWKKGPHDMDKHELFVTITDTGNDYYWLSAKLEGVEMRPYTSKIIKIEHW